jgi:hypothetical protein
MSRPSRQVAKVAATVAGAVCSTLLFGALHTGAASGLRCLARGPTAAAGNAHQRRAAVWSRTTPPPRLGAGSGKGRHCQPARPELRLRGNCDARCACSPTLGVVSCDARCACSPTWGLSRRVAGDRGAMHRCLAWHVSFRRVLCESFTASRAPICRGGCSQRRRR